MSAITSVEGDVSPAVTPSFADVRRLRIPLAGSRLASVNAYLLGQDGDYVLVDGGWGTDECFDALLSSLTALSVPIHQVRRAAVTHYHADHFGLTSRVARLSNAQVLIHEDDLTVASALFGDTRTAERERIAWLGRNGWMEENAGVPASAELERLRHVDIPASVTILRDGDILRVGGFAWQVVWVPGHTPGHVCLLEPTRGLLISGDHLLDPITPHIGAPRPSSRNALGRYLGSLERLLPLNVSLVLPGHGDPFRDVPRRVAELRTHHDERSRRILAIVRHRASTAADVSRQLTWTRSSRTFAELPTLQQRLAVAETIAHAEHLRDRGALTTTDRNGVVYYAVARIAE